MSLSGRSCDLLPVERLSRRKIPQAHDALVSSAEDDPLDLSLLALPLPLLDRHLDEADRLQRLKHGQRPPENSPVEIPHIHDLVPPTAHERVPIRRDVQSPHNADMPIKDVQALARPQVPNADLAVVRTAHQPRSLPSICDIENERADNSSMALEHVRAVTLVGVPDLDDSVCGAGCEESAGGVGGAGDDGGFVGLGDGAVEGEGWERVDLESEGASSGKEIAAGERRRGGGSDGEGRDGGSILRYGVSLVQKNRGEQIPRRAP